MSPVSLTAHENLCARFPGLPARSGLVSSAAAAVPYLSRDYAIWHAAFSTSTRSRLPTDRQPRNRLLKTFHAEIRDVVTIEVQLFELYQWL